MLVFAWLEMPRWFVGPLMSGCSQWFSKLRLNLVGPQSRIVLVCPCPMYFLKSASILRTFFLSNPFFDLTTSYTWISLGGAPETERYLLNCGAPSHWAIGFWQSKHITSIWQGKHINYHWSYDPIVSLNLIGPLWRIGMERHICGRVASFVLPLLWRQSEARVQTAKVRLSSL